MQAQSIDSTEMVTVFMKGDKVYSGKLIKITGDTIYIDHATLGLQALDKKQVRRIKDGILPKRFPHRTNASTPYVVPTAIPLGRGNNYYKNIYIFGNEINSGINDYLSLSIGFETASLVFFEGSFPVMQLGVKASGKVSENLYSGVVTNFIFNSNFGAFFTIFPVTLGNKSTNWTISPGYYNDSGNDGFVIFSNLSAALSRKTRLVLDFFHVDGESVVSASVEFQSNGGFTISPGFLMGIPSLTFTVPFGKWKNDYHKMP